MHRYDDLAEVRPDSIEKVTGRAGFITDLTVPGMLHAFVVRSTAVHARIRSVGIAAALAVPGVIDVIRGEDLARFGRWGLVLKDRPVLAIDRVRFVGEPVAVVIAENEATAENAAELVEVDYESLPRAADARAALAPGAPLLHEAHENLEDFYFKGGAKPIQGSNCFHRFLSEVGDVDAAEARAHLVHEDRYSFPAIFHYALEPHAVIADYQDDGLTVWAGAQTPAAVQKVLSRLFGIPLAKVRVIVPFVGGGFGGKASVKLEPLVAACSWKLRRPVRLAQSLTDSMLTCRRLGAEITIRTAVDAEGRILSKRADILMDGGAYADTGSAVATKAANRIIGPYAIPNLRLESRAVYTNTVPGASFRSIGGPQAVWAAECHMDNVAARLGLSPVEFRMRNLAARGQRIRPDLRALDMDMGEMMGRLGQAFGPHENRTRARGLALAATDPGIVPLGNALVRLKVDGSILIAVSSVEIGQGVHATLARIAAETLRQPFGAVTVLPTDTGIAPYDWGTGASRSTVIAGSAVELAAQDAAAQMLDLAAHVLDCPREALSLAPGGIDSPAGFHSFVTLFHRAYGVDSGEIVGRGALSPLSRQGALREAPVFWETAAGMAEISVDEETGELTLHRYATAADVGRVINRVMAESQDEGATIMGLGHALFEQLEFEDGQPVNASAFDYAIPTIEDVPAKMDTILVENRDGPGPGGAKGMGEGAILPVAPALSNALFARYGIRINDLPMTPEKIWRAIRDRS